MSGTSFSVGKRSETEGESRVVLGAQPGQALEGQCECLRQKSRWLARKTKIARAGDVRWLGLKGQQRNFLNFESCSCSSKNIDPILTTSYLLRSSTYLLPSTFYPLRHNFICNHSSISLAAHLAHPQSDTGANEYLERTTCLFPDQFTHTPRKTCRAGCSPPSRGPFQLLSARQRSLPSQERPPLSRNRSLNAAATTKRCWITIPTRAMSDPCRRTIKPSAPVSSGLQHVATS